MILEEEIIILAEEMVAIKKVDCVECHKFDV